MDPGIRDAVNPHYTFTFGDCNGTCKVEHVFSVSEIRQLWNCLNKSILHQFRGYSKAISNQPEGDQEIVVRTIVES